MARVLVVDDDPIVLAFAEKALSRRHDVRTLLIAPGVVAADVEALVGRLSPDVLVTDYDMPLRPELLFAWVRGASPRARVVLFTASILGSPELARLGPDACVPKPCRLVELLEAVG